MKVITVQTDDGIFEVRVRVTRAARPQIRKCHCLPELLKAALTERCGIMKNPKYREIYREIFFRFWPRAALRKRHGFPHVAVDLTLKDGVYSAVVSTGGLELGRLLAGEE